MSRARARRHTEERLYSKTPGKTDNSPTKGGLANKFSAWHGREACPPLIAYDAHGEYVEAAEALPALIDEIRDLGLDLAVFEDGELLRAIILDGEVLVLRTHNKEKKDEN